MQTLNLSQIESCENISKKEFSAEYVYKCKPLILKDFSKDWPALEKWTLSYLKTVSGDLEVPLFKEAFANNGQSYTKGQLKMLFADYLDLIVSKPTNLRMFLFNIFKHIPALCDDFTYPDLMDTYLKKYPFMFFGGKNSWVDAHYDADLSHVFLTQFLGRRRITLYHPSYSTFLYRHPLTVSTNVDINAPDFEKYPLLHHAKGYECILNPGETLFIPSGYWHHVFYLEGGFGLSLRAPTKNLFKRVEGLFNIFKLTVIDYSLSTLFSAKKWYATKERVAVRKAQRLASSLNITNGKT